MRAVARGGGGTAVVPGGGLASMVVTAPSVKVRGDHRGGQDGGGCSGGGRWHGEEAGVPPRQQVDVRRRVGLVGRCGDERGRSTRWVRSTTDDKRGGRTEGGRRGRTLPRLRYLKIQGCTSFSNICLFFKIVLCTYCIKKGGSCNTRLHEPTPGPKKPKAYSPNSYDQRSNLARHQSCIEDRTRRQLGGHGVTPIENPIIPLQPNQLGD
jgi:hypothetical protein